MILPPVINTFYIHVKQQYVNIAGRFATPQYGVHILNGHYIDVLNETGNQIFYETLNKLSKEVEFISFEEGSRLIHAKKIPVHEKLVCFTFDDGYEECFTKIKPVLDVFNIKAGFFICPNFVEAPPQYVDSFLKNAVFLKTRKLPMTWQQIKKLHDEGHLIGSHTMNHINCREASLDVLNKELKEAKEIIENKLQLPCEHFAYPYGKLEHFSEQALSCAKQYYKYIYSQAGHQNYFSFNGNVINRRHFEGNWEAHHITYYLKKN